MKYSLLTNIATLWKIGHVRKAPGTAGSFFALLLAPLCFLPFSLPIRILILIALFALGVVCANRAEEEMQTSDPSSVIIDELVGQWVTLLPINVYSYFNASIFTFQEMYILIMCFLFFRIFDISKIGPVGLCERKVKGGLGIMLDDVVAGIFASLFAYPLQYYANLLF